MSNAVENVALLPSALPEPAPARFRLRLLLREVTFDAEEVTIGRGAECALSIEDDLLSRRHAAIVRRGDGFEIVDLGSRNGTRLNGRTIRAPTPLRPDDRIRLGRSEVVFVAVDDRGEPNWMHRLETASFRACLACGEGRPAAVEVCPQCGTPAPAPA